MYLGWKIRKVEIKKREIENKMKLEVGRSVASDIASLLATMLVGASMVR